MFGLEGKKEKNPSEEIVFDLEKDLMDLSKKKGVIQIVEKRLQRLKEILRAGVEQEEVEKLGIIFNGYNSFLKVVSRPVSPKK